MEYSRSDHRPILMSLETGGSSERFGPAMLRFEAKWLKEAHFQQVVEEAWEQAGVQIQTGSLAGKLSVVHNLLHKWDKNVLQNTKRRIRNSQKEMEKVLSGPLNDETIQQQKELAKVIEELLEKRRSIGRNGADLIGSKLVTKIHPISITLQVKGGKRI